MYKDNGRAGRDRTKEAKKLRKKKRREGKAGRKFGFFTGYDEKTQIGFVLLEGTGREALFRFGELEAAGVALPESLARMSFRCTQNSAGAIWVTDLKIEPHVVRKGRVKYFNRGEGFGFVTPDDGGKDVFLFITDVRVLGVTGLADKTPIEYVVVPDKRGVRARKLRLI